MTTVRAVGTEEEKPKQTTGQRLREMARWFDKHPNAPVPYYFEEGSSYFKWVSGEDFKTLARKIGRATKEFNANDARLVVQVGELRIVYYTSRDEVCVKKIVGYKRVPERVVPGYVEAEHDEPIVEWDCPESILAKATPQG